MKLSDHVNIIRERIYKSFNNQFSRLGISPTKLSDLDKIPTEIQDKRQKIEVLINSHLAETGTYAEAREKALDELTFTLFNRLASIKVMEAHQLFSPIVTKQAVHGNRSFGHKIWLEKNPEKSSDDQEGLRDYFKYEFDQLGVSIPLFSKNYPYALLPYVIELNEIVDAFNAVEQDAQIEDNIWESDDILGWLYESYNNVKKQLHKDSGDKTEYDKVSLQSQVYTPRWVVEFLVHNSLGKLYLEMYPDSEIKDRYKIANAPKTRSRDIQPLHEIKLIDPASGSGNFLLYAFAFFYALYQDQIDNYGADYEEEDIPKLIIENNLHGIDLDDRAIQLAQLGLWIKAKQKNRNLGAVQFNVVSSDFYLPDFEVVEPIFKTSVIDGKQLSIIEDIWGDLQQAYKFGSLVKIEEKLSVQLHGIVDRQGITLFGAHELDNYLSFKEEFFTNLETAITKYAQGQGSFFLTDKTKDAITFLKLITQKYDVATANPPYTGSYDFGKDLKKFIDTNYSKPYKFHTNLYSTFIKRCFELTNDEGKVAMVHPPTFMYIKTFEDVRKFILEKSHIDLFVEWGYLGMFHQSARVDASMYVVEKKVSIKKDTTFIKLNHIYEGKRYSAFVEAYDNLIENIEHSNNYSLPQSKLKIIKSYPFIYWISDEFREKFKKRLFKDVAKSCIGLSTGNNEQFIRYWWELNNDSYFFNSEKCNKWIFLAKGGEFSKWLGNLWLVVNVSPKNKFNIYENPNSTLRNKQDYYKPGIFFNRASSKGVSTRILPEGCVFESSVVAIFPNEKSSINYTLAFTNSKVYTYIASCLNATVSFQAGDNDRVPFVLPSEELSFFIDVLVDNNLKIKSKINNFKLFEQTFQSSPINYSSDINFRSSLMKFFFFENFIKAQILVNEAIINEKVFEIYELTPSDKAMVLAKEGESIGGLPVLAEAKMAYLNEEVAEFPLDQIKDFIENLEEKEFSVEEKEKVVSEFPNLYQSNNDLEEFCIRHQVNPINVWYWFKQSNVIPKQRMNTLAMEFLADMIREILMEDDDGIIPLVPNAGESILLDRIEQKFIEKGFSMAQYSSFDGVLGRNIKDYLNGYFFKALSDHLNLFMYLPKTPFIWHLTSGAEQGFDCYIIIYKWNRDKLLRIRSVYIERRERSLINRQSDLLNDTSASAQNEKDKIYKQLKEIESFKAKIDELLTEGYNPILDDGVGKNIAPLQKKGMLAYEVLNAGQLKKYLNADW